MTWRCADSVPGPPPALPPALRTGPDQPLATLVLILTVSGEAAVSQCGKQM